MKLLLTCCVFLFLQGCETLNTQTQFTTPGTIPNAWIANGRASISANDRHQSVSFNIQFVDQDFELVLMGALGLGEVNLRSTTHSLLVDHSQTPLNLQQWMEQELGWYFPFDVLPSIIFEHRSDVNNEWQVEINKFMPYKGMSVAKVVKLQHQDKPIKIKLLLQEVNQLK